MPVYLAPPPRQRLGDHITVIAGMKSELDFADFLTISWFIIDAFTHMTIEAGYVYLGLTVTAAKSDSFMGFIWREYGRADKRWSVRDPTVIALEIATVCLGPVCLWCAFCVYARKPYRHVLQIIICTAELYGGWMTFAPEWIEGCPNLDGSTFTLLWIYLTFMNGLWVLLPLVLLWESVAQVTAACSKAKTEHVTRNLASGAPPLGLLNVAAATLGLYLVLVPLVLFTSSGVPVQA